MTLLEWLKLPKEQWKPARAIFTRGRRPTLDLAIEIERQLKALEAERDGAREALKNIPFHEYSEAKEAGCDATGAWDCFLEAASKYVEKSLKENPVGKERLK